MSDSRVAEAVDIVARRLIVDLVEWGIGDAWGDWVPDVGDSTRARTAFQSLLTCPSIDAYGAAYGYLVSRAENEA